MILFSRSVVSSSLRPRGLQHTRLPCPSPSPRACANSCPLSQWCHPIISSSVVPFFSCFQSFPASGSFLMGQLFKSGVGASASASVPPMNIQDWFPLGLTGLISLQSKGLSRVFSNTTVQALANLSFLSLSFPVCEIKITWTSLLVQWLGLCLPTWGIQVQPLVRELRSHMPLCQEAKTLNRSNSVTSSRKT